VYNIHKGFINFLHNLFMEEQQKQLASMHHHAPHYFSLAILVIVVGLAGIAMNTAGQSSNFTASVIAQATKTTGKQVVTKKALPVVKTVAASSFSTFEFMSNGDEKMIVALPEKHEEDSDGGLLGGLGLSSLNPLDVIKRSVNPIAVLKDGVDVTKKVTGQIIKNANPINGTKKAIEMTKDVADIAKDGLNPLNVVKNGLRPDRIGILDPRTDGNDDDVYYSYRKVSKKSVVIEEAKEGGLPAAVEGSSWVNYRKNLAKKGATQYTRYMAVETINLPSGTPVSGVLSFKSLEDQIEVYVNNVKVFSTKKVELKTAAQAIDITTPLKPGKNVIKILAQQNQAKRHAGGFSYRGSVVLAQPAVSAVDSSSAATSPVKLAEIVIPGSGEEMTLSSLDAVIKISNFSTSGAASIMDVLKEAKLVDSATGAQVAVATAWVDDEGAGECEVREGGLLCHFGTSANPLKYPIKQNIGGSTSLSLLVSTNVSATVQASLVGNSQSLMSKVSSRYFTLPSIAGSSTLVNP
jgi:hypothetical protein